MRLLVRLILNVCLLTSVLILVNRDIWSNWVIAFVLGLVVLDEFMRGGDL